MLPAVSSGGNAGAEEAAIKKLALLLAHPDINVNLATPTCGFTALHVASGGGRPRPEIVRLLLRAAGIRVSAVDVNGETALHRACLSGNVAVVRAFLGGHGAGADDVGNVGHEDLNRAAAPTGFTPMHVACAEGHAGVVKVLAADARVLLGARDRSGSTPLHLAVKSGCVDTAKALLVPQPWRSPMGSSDGLQGDRADVNARWVGGKGRFNTYSSAQSSVCVDLFLSRIVLRPWSTRFRDSVGLTPLHHACIKGRWEVVAALLLTVVGVRERDSSYGSRCDGSRCSGACDRGESSLAGIYESIGMVLDVNAVDDFGESALHKACTRGWEQVVRLLLQHPGVDANVRSSDQSLWKRKDKSCRRM